MSDYDDFEEQDPVIEVSCPGCGASGEWSEWRDEGCCPECGCRNIDRADE
jgi:hypothetical protein